MMTTPHPTDRTLAALIDGRLDSVWAEVARRHIDGCPRCQMRVGSADAAALPRTGPAETGPRASLAVPLLEPVAAQPKRADVWRLAWDTTVLLAVIWNSDSDRVHVLPVVDTADADEWSAVLLTARTGGLGELAVSVALETAVPWSVLDARITQLADTEALTSLRRAYRTGAATSADRGAPVGGDLDDRLVGLDQVAEDLQELANASWAPIAVEQSEVAFDFDQLSEAGLPANRVLGIIRGSAPSEDEADLIEAATGVRPAPAAVPDDLRRTIDQPRRKAAIRARALSAGSSEATVRLALARHAEPQLAAARGTQGVPPDYDDILDRILDA